MNECWCLQNNAARSLAKLKFWSFGGNCKLLYVIHPCVGLDQNYELQVVSVKTSWPTMTRLNFKLMNCNWPTDNIKTWKWVCLQSCESTSVSKKLRRIVLGHVVSGIMLGILPLRPLLCQAAKQILSFAYSFVLFFLTKQRSARCTV